MSDILNSGSSGFGSPDEGGDRGFVARDRSQELAPAAEGERIGFGAELAAETSESGEVVPERPSPEQWKRLLATNPADALEYLPLIFSEDQLDYVRPLVERAAAEAVDFTGLPTYKIFRNRLLYAFGNDTGREAPDDTQVKESEPQVEGVVLLSGVLPESGQADLDSLETLGERRDQVVLDEDGNLVLPTSMAMGFIDLKAFKALNDHRGHAAGDVGLRDMGIKLSEGLRALEHGFGPAHFVAHRSGDEYVVCIPGVTEAEAAGIIQRLADYLKEVAMSLELGEEEEVEILRACIAGAYAPDVSTYEEAIVLLFAADDHLNTQKQEERRANPRA